MASTRRLATAAGICFFVTHVTSIGGLALYGPVLHDPGFVLGPGPDTRVLLGALSEVLLVLGIVGTAVALYPVARRHSEAGAVGYLGLRVLEAAVIAVGIVALLAVVTLRRDAAGGQDAAALTTTAGALVAVHDWTFLLGPNFVCGANTTVIAYVVYRSGLVPRPVAVLGLIGGPLIFASAVAVLLGRYEQLSGWGALTALPVFAWELALAGRLVARGFTSARHPARAAEQAAVPA
ncbi:DUF4386 domain-containing protein [Kitasatospora sp. NPDC051914]|uniref:DUF4386 domain-containing protein n=1 Tax=Kitasatospora sp. NPDC051914 TaxID=3154945 RepID=UPI00342B21C8